MKTTKLLIVLGIIALVALAGCSGSAEKSYAPSGQKYVGGGCGVGAPAEEQSAAERIASTAESTTAL